MPLDTTGARQQVAVRAAVVRLALAVGVVATMLAVLWYSPFARGLRRDQAQARAGCEATYERLRQWSVANPDSDTATVRADGSDEAAYVESCLAETLEPTP